MTNSKLQKIGRLMVPNGKYTDKNGNEKTRWHEIGIVLATPHHSNMCVKLHANGFGEGQFCSVFYDEDKAPNFSDSAPSDNATANSDDFNSEDIPF